MSSPLPLTLTRPQPDEGCSCGSGERFGNCCGPLLARERLAATAEQLMRARFSAHVAHDYLFLHQTYLPTSNTPFVEEKDSGAMPWTKLTVHSHESGTDPNLAYVEFSAFYLVDGGTQEFIQERSEFRRVNGEWFYSRLVRQGPAPFKSPLPKTGRNDPCPCGSGKKYKHCCLGKA